MPPVPEVADSPAVWPFVRGIRQKSGKGFLLFGERSLEPDLLNPEHFLIYVFTCQVNVLHHAAQVRVPESGRENRQRRSVGRCPGGKCVPEVVGDERQCRRLSENPRLHNAMLARGVISARLRKDIWWGGSLKEVALRDPVVPVTDGLVR